MAGPSAFPEITAALVTRLRARPNLINVNVLDQIPVNKDDIRTESGAFEVIAMTEGADVWNDVVFCGGDLRFDESLTVTVLHEVQGVDSSATQAAVKRRVNELLHETLADVAAQADWDKAALGLDVFDYLFFTPSGGRWVPGRLQQTGVFAAAYELDLGVRSRISFT